MNKREAIAILTCKKRIEAALDQCIPQLSSEKEYALGYWAAHIRKALNDGEYGSAPIARAEDILEAWNK